MNEWYRQKSWSKAEEEYFFAKIGRARKSGRAQYLKIQAAELIQTEEKKLLDIAEVLINKLLSEYPENRLNRSQALGMLGDIWQFRNNYMKAIEYYKEAIDFELIFPNVRTQAYMSYSELVIKTQKTDLYNIVEKMISEKITSSLFPIEKYKGYSILSIINNYKDNAEKALYFKELAEQNANKQTSELRYHKYLGVVKEKESWLDRLVQKVTKQKPQP